MKRTPTRGRSRGPGGIHEIILKTTICHMLWRSLALAPPSHDHEVSMSDREHLSRHAYASKDRKMISKISKISKIRLMLARILKGRRQLPNAPPLLLPPALFSTLGPLVPRDDDGGACKNRTTGCKRRRRESRCPQAVMELSNKLGVGERVHSALQVAVALQL